MDFTRIDEQDFEVDFEAAMALAESNARMYRTDTFDLDQDDPYDPQECDMVDGEPSWY